MRPAVVLLNEHAGGGHDADSLARRLRRSELQAQVNLVRAEDLARAARDHAGAGARVVVAAGGDGTVSAVARGLLGTKATIGILPMGSRNHFARDLGIPLRLPRAANVIRKRRVRRVDAASVNGHVFVNNASIGLYPNWVLQRDHLARGGLTKNLGALVAAGAVLRRYARFDVRVGVGDRVVRRRTPFVFVGNNVYRLRGQRIGARSRLDGGQLSVVVGDAATRVDLVRVAARSLLRGLRSDAGLEEIRRPEAWVHPRKRHARFAIDGELTRLKSPLHFESQPRALRVLAPGPGL